MICAINDYIFNGIKFHCELDYKGLSILKI